MALTKKRCLLWDWTNTAHCPNAIEHINFSPSSPLSSLCNWNTWAPPELKARLPFHPTIRTEAQLSGQDWANITSSSRGSLPIIHYFNEPERAGIAPARAAEAWMKQMLPLRREKGSKLVSPSCASDAAGEQWLADFMGRVDGGGQGPDFLGLHYYGTHGEAAVRYIEEMHRKYPRLPVIVSEIASISRDKEEVLEFTAHLANWMDETEWIFEYAFFGCMTEVADSFVSPEAQLMKKDGEFTELMMKLMTEQPIKV